MKKMNIMRHTEMKTMNVATRQGGNVLPTEQVDNVLSCSKILTKRASF